MSTLYLVATPIGNLGDLSPRAREILSTVDFIAAEDTRVTQKLLTACELPRKPMISYYEHNRRARGTGNEKQCAKGGTQKFTEFHAEIIIILTIKQVENQQKNKYNR